MKKIIIDTLRILNSKQNTTLHFVLILTLIVLGLELIITSIYSNDYFLLAAAMLKLILALSTMKYAVHALYNLCLDAFKKPSKI